MAPVVVITRLEGNDVLLGRGTGPNTNPGNKKFRVLAREMLKRTKEFVSPGDGSATKLASIKKKTVLAEELVAMVQSKKGRFVRKLTREETGALAYQQIPKPQKKALKMSQLPDMYVIVSDFEAVEKAKQSFRHQMRFFLARQEKSKSKISKCTEDVNAVLPEKRYEGFSSASRPETVGEFSTSRRPKATSRKTSNVIRRRSPALLTTPANVSPVSVHEFPSGASPLLQGAHLLRKTVLVNNRRQVTDRVKLPTLPDLPSNSSQTETDKTVASSRHEIYDPQSGTNIVVAPLGPPPFPLQMAPAGSHAACPRLKKKPSSLYGFRPSSDPNQNAFLAAMSNSQASREQQSVIDTLAALLQMGRT